MFLECTRIFTCALPWILFKMLNLKGSPCSKLGLWNGQLLRKNSLSGCLLPFPQNTLSLGFGWHYPELWAINFEFHHLHKQRKLKPMAVKMMPKSRHTFTAFRALYYLSPFCFAFILEPSPNFILLILDHLDSI